MFEAALADPESLADLPGVDPEEVENEGLRSAVQEAYEAAYDEEMPDSGVHAPREPAGDEWDEDDVYRLYPRLAAEFG